VVVFVFSWGPHIRGSGTYDLYVLQRQPLLIESLRLSLLLPAFAAGARSNAPACAVATAAACTLWCNHNALPSGLVVVRFGLGRTHGC
jgi:hypothetical protein